MPEYTMRTIQHSRSINQTGHASIFLAVLFIFLIFIPGSVPANSTAPPANSTIPAGTDKKADANQPQQAPAPAGAGSFDTGNINDATIQRVENAGNIWDIDESGDKEPGSLSLSECVSRALKYHPLIKKAEEDLKNSEAQVTQARSDYYPTLTFGGSYSQGLDTGSTTNGGFPVSERRQVGFSATQNIDDFGQRDNLIKQALYNLDAQKYNYELERQTIIYGARNSYYNVDLKAKLLLVASDELEQFNMRLKTAEAFYEQGLKPYSEVTKAQTDYYQSEYRFITAKNFYKLAWAQLASSMGTNRSTQFKMADSLTEVKFTASLNDVLKWGNETRLEVLIARSNVKAAKANLDAVVSQFNPNLNASAGYNMYGRAQDPTSTNANNWNWSVNMSVPVFDGFNISSQVKQARASYLSTMADYEDVLLSSDLNIKTAYYTIMENLEKIYYAKSGLKQAQENYDLEKGRYDVGLATALEFTDARRLLSESQASYYQALYDLQQAYDSLMLSIGRLE
ncbi:MAG: TolC family protein [Chloroflexi bacterium]|nr:TolC family protein [Chloroflexota bacterium]